MGKMERFCLGDVIYNPRSRLVLCRRDLDSSCRQVAEDFEEQVSDHVQWGVLIDSMALKFRRSRSSMCRR